MDPTATSHPKQASGDPARRSPAKAYLAAALVLVTGIIGAAVWALLAVGPWIGDIGDLPRSPIPGETTVTIDEAEGQVVYLEREQGFGGAPTDFDGDVEVEVTGPDGSAVPTSEYDGTVQYRTFQRVGVAHVTFDPPEPGEYTVSVEGDVDADSFAVGRSIVGPLARDLVPPAILFLVSVVVAVTIAVRAATRNQPDPV